MGTTVSSTRLVVSGIELVGPHGWYPQEQREGSRFRIDLEIEGALEKPITTDRLEDTIDYTEVVAAVRDVNKSKRFHLIESFGGAIADELFRRFPKISRLTVRVRKITLPGLEKGIWVTFALTKERE